MEKKTLKQRLIDDGYPETPGLDATVDRLLNFKGNPAQMFEEWYTTKKLPTFEPIDGIDAQYLRQNLRMKDPAIIIAYAMMIDNRKENVPYLKELAQNRIIFIAPKNEKK